MESIFFVLEFAVNGKVRERTNLTSGRAFAYDLAVCLHAWCYGTAYQPDLAAALLAGYRDHRELDRETADALYPFARYAALRYTASRIHAFHLAQLGADRLAWKDWTRYRDRLRALREMGEARFRQLVGV